MSEVKVNKISPRSGTTVTLGDSGDTFTLASGVSLTGVNATFSGDLTVDTDTLYVDSTNNNVGIGTSSPNSLLEVKNTDGLTGIELHREFSGDVSGDTNTPKLDFTLSDTATSNQVIATISPQGSAGTGDAFEGNLRFFTANSSGSTTEAMRIDSSQNLDMTNGGGNIKLANGAGIDFSATANSSGTMSSELLDDYEEGTWTPTTNVGTVVGTDCKYTKVGRKVFLQGRFDTFSDRTSAVAIYINDLPFAQSSTQTSTGSLMYRYIDTNTNFHSIVGFCPSGGSQITFYEVGDNQNWSQLLHNQLASANSRIYFSATYTTD